jgi:dipeptidyl-peptidase-4
MRSVSIDLRRGVDVHTIEQYARTERFTVGRPTRFVVTDDGQAVYFLRAVVGEGPARALHVWERATGQERLLATAAQLLGGSHGEEVLDAVERARRERQRVTGQGITDFRVSPDGARVLVPLSGRLFVIERLSGSVSELPSQGGPPIDARFSPDGRLVSLVRGGELHVIDLATRVERALTHGATDDRTHAVAEFVAQEELGRMEGYWWSPDGAEIVYQENDLSRVERLHIAHPSHPERSPEVTAYPRAGTPNVAIRLGVVSVHGGDTTWIRWDAVRYPYVVTVRWQAGAPLTLVVMTRAQDEVAVVTVLPDGRTRIIHTERDAAWVDTVQGLPQWSRDGRSFLWRSEREGHGVVERYDRDGTLLAALTPRTLDVRALLGWDEARDELYVAASDDPTQTHVLRVRQGPDGPRTEDLTPEPGEHELVLAGDASLQVRTAHTLTALPVTTVHDRDGRRLATLASQVETPRVFPRVELRTVGTDGFRAAIVRPSNHSPARRRPVVVWVYGGPGVRVVTHAAERYFVQQWLADQGFHLVLADGRGTPARGRDWERAIRLHLGDVPLADQVSALRALGAIDPTLDLSRVGILGWSFGGYLAARAVIERPDVFHAAVAGAPVTDWRDYDTCYTERFLGLPDVEREAYERASLLPRAPSLRRPLLIVHGTSDDNVYFHNGLRLADVLFRAGRRFDFLPLAGQTHVVHAPDLVVAWLLRARQFFVEHLRPFHSEPL